MSRETAEWLISQRERRGWNRPEMARQLLRAGEARGERHLPDTGSIQRNIYRWEHGSGVSHLFVTLYCDVFDISFTEFPRQARSRSAQKNGADLTVCEDPHILDLGHMTYRGIELPSGSATVEHEVMMTAHESSDHAADREQPGVGDVTFEQLRADVTRLSRLTDTGSPLAAFMDTRRVRDRIYRLLDRRLWPREQTDLYFLLGCANTLMGLNANRLGYPDAAEELIRAGWAYANAIDHNPLRAKLRAMLSSINYWRGRFTVASDLAADGLRYVSQGPLGADLRLNQARAMARIGDPGAARHAVGLAHDAQGIDYSDDLIELGGVEFASPLTMMYTMAGNALAETGNDGRDAASELEHAISLYDGDPTPGEEHLYAGKALAGTHLAVVRLQNGELDGAATALGPVLILAPEQRITSITTRLAVVRDELAAPAFRDSPLARDLGDRIEDFTREAVTGSLHSLSG